MHFMPKKDKNIIFSFGSRFMDVQICVLERYWLKKWCIAVCVLCIQDGI